jgi:hypothetical protein
MGDVVLVGLSGGIDSSAAGLLAREKWPDLPFYAIHQDLGWDDPAAEEDARKIAELIDAEITVQRTDIGEIWRERKYIPMAGMPCPASRQLKAEPAMIWAAETLGGSARWQGGSVRNPKNRKLVFDKMPEHDGLYCIGFIAGEEGRAARYRGSWPDELGKPIFPLLATGKNKDDARAVLKRHGVKINYNGLPRRSCQPCVHWSSKEREILRTIRPEHAERVTEVELAINRTFDKRGPMISLPTRTPYSEEQGSFVYVDGACGAWCR